MKGIFINASGNSNWIGGLYYAKNIAFVLSQNDWIVSHYLIVLYVHPDNYSMFKDLPKSVVVIKGSKRNGLLGKIKKALISIKYNIKFSFLGGKDLSKIGIKNIYWIPDFQHKHYPELFPIDEIDRRESRNFAIANSDYSLVLSSNDSLNDFRKYYSKNKKNVYVVPFVSYISEVISSISEITQEKVLQKYNLDKGKYLCVMNQFWQHKNHIVVLRALELFFSHNPDSDLKVVFTGSLKEFRNPDYINLIKSEMLKPTIKQHIVLLGFIDRDEQIVIMQNSQFIIQPSLFEGWGTVVEDAKVLDKTIVLSDIPVHREQMNNKCILFDPHNPCTLEKCISEEIKKEHHDDVNDGIENMYNQAKKYSIGFEKLLKDLEG